MRASRLKRLGKRRRAAAAAADARVPSTAFPVPTEATAGRARRVVPLPLLSHDRGPQGTAAADPGAHLRVPGKAVSEPEGVGRAENRSAGSTTGAAVGSGAVRGGEETLPPSPVPLNTDGEGTSVLLQSSATRALSVSSVVLPSAVAGTMQNMERPPPRKRLRLARHPATGPQGLQPGDSAPEDTPRAPQTPRRRFRKLSRRAVAEPGRIARDAVPANVNVSDKYHSSGAQHTETQLGARRDDGPATGDAAPADPFARFYAPEASTGGRTEPRLGKDNSEEEEHAAMNAEAEVARADAGGRERRRRLVSARRARVEAVRETTRNALQDGWHAEARSATAQRDAKDRPSKRGRAPQQPEVQALVDLFLNRPGCRSGRKTSSADALHGRLLVHERDRERD